MAIACSHGIQIRLCDACNARVGWRATLQGVAHATPASVLEGRQPLCGTDEPRIFAASASTPQCNTCLAILARSSESPEPSPGQKLDDRLRPESDLAELGYNVSKLDRDHRWRLLTVAVQHYGVRHVIWLLEGHVELRLKQRNGAERYAYAIREWHHDIARLRREYDG